MALLVECSPDMCKALGSSSVLNKLGTWSDQVCNSSSWGVLEEGHKFKVSLGYWRSCGKKKRKKKKYVGERGGAGI